MPRVTFDEQLTVVSLAIGGIAMIAGIVAAVYAFRADRATRRGSRVEDHRWKHTIQPRPKVGFDWSAPSLGAPALQSITFSMGNPGGAVTQGYVAIQVGQAIYGTGFNIIEHAIPLMWAGVPKIGDAPTSEPRRVLLIVAQDIEGNWWDVGAEAIVKDFPPEGVGGVRFEQWLNQRLAGVWARDKASQ